MTIQVGDRIPDSEFFVMTANGPDKISSTEVFAGKKVVLFAVPGAYTPTCDQKHLPGFVERLDEIKAKGYDSVACTAVNDIFVLDRWARESKAAGRILMLGDGAAVFAKKIGLDVDLSGFGLGVRSKRYVMVVEDGVVKLLNVEDAPPDHGVSSAETVCTALERGL